MPIDRSRVLIPAVLAVFAAASARPAAVRADAVTDWNIQANATINSTGPSAHAAVVSLAIVHGAVYDAVNAIAGGYRPYLGAPAAHPADSQDAAAAAAAFHVLMDLVPAQAGALQARYDQSLAAIP
ncbi:MAG TPA: PA-phosphatase, partial [Vicinamibacteria bacterium]